jgi:hypothetical protein
LTTQVCSGAGGPNTADTKTAKTIAAKNGIENSLKFIDYNFRTEIPSWEWSPA